MHSEEDLSYLYFETASITQDKLDMLLADGWRHFGTFFFRDKVNFHNGKNVNVIPVRINLDKFKLSKSQKKIWNKNQDVEVVFRTAFVDEEKEVMFHKHAARFKRNIPPSIYTFISEQPDSVPCEIKECAVYADKKLYAVSFIDVGINSLSSIYAMFDPDYADRSPGLHTLLLEAEFAKQNNFKYHYLGYTYIESSHYDYKKKFYGLEAYDWDGHWNDFEREV